MNKSKKEIAYIVAAIVIIIALVVGIFILKKPDIYNVQTGENTVMKRQTIVTQLDDKILLYKNDNLIFKKNYKKDTPYYFDGKNLYLIDKKDLLKYNTKGDIDSKLSFESDITGIYADNDYMIVDTKTKSQIVKDMKITEDLELNGEVASLLAANKSNYSFSTIGAREGRIFSKIYMYDENGLLYKNIFLDRTIFDMKYIDNKLVVVFDDSIKVFENSKIVNSVSFDKAKKIGISENNIFIITENSELLIYNDNMGLVYRKPIDGDFQIYSNNKNCILYNQNGYATFDGTKLVEIKTSNLKSICGEDDFYLVYDNKIERIR